MERSYLSPPTFPVEYMWPAGYCSHPADASTRIKKAGVAVDPGSMNKVCLLTYFTSEEMSNLANSRSVAAC